MLQKCKKYLTKQQKQKSVRKDKKWQKLLEPSGFTSDNKACIIYINNITLKKCNNSGKYV